MPPTTCPLCSNPSPRPYSDKKNYSLYRCGRCHLIFLWPVPPHTSSLYGPDYFTGAKLGFGYSDYEQDKLPMAKTFRRYLQEIEVFKPDRGKLLDVGAASGFFLEQAQTSGWAATGLEISKYACQLAINNNMPVRHGELQDNLFPPNSFDVVTMWDVLEHLPDPHSSLSIISRLLKKDGLLALNTPDSSSLIANLARQRWHLLIPPEHIYLYSRQALPLLLAKHDFQITSIKRIGKSYTLSYLFSILYGWRGAITWKKLSARLKKSDLNNRISVPINLRDNIFVIAQKTKPKISPASKTVHGRKPK